MTEGGCILCANGNDLPDGETCECCGREGNATGLRAAIIRARGRASPPTVPVKLVDLKYDALVEALRSARPYIERALEKSHHAYDKAALDEVDAALSQEAPDAGVVPSAVELCSCGKVAGSDGDKCFDCFVYNRENEAPDPAEAGTTDGESK